MIEYQNTFIHIVIKEPDNDEEKKVFDKDFEGAMALMLALSEVITSENNEEGEQHVRIFGKDKEMH